MTMILKSKECCPVIDCKYRKSANGVGECYGAKEDRESEFVCNFVGTKEISEREMPYFPDTTIRGKTILQG